MKTYIDFDVHKIQEVRLLQALSETEHIVIVPKAQDFKFASLKIKFGMVYTVSNTINTEDLPLSKLIKIDHKLPKTSLANVTCPLIFPKEIVTYLFKNWSSNRVYAFSFSGLITPIRHSVIQKWLLEGLKSDKKLNYNSKSFKSRVLRKVRKFFNVHKSFYKYDDLYLSNSFKGRVFPDKSWDEPYYTFLLKSKFVLCPSGDFVWSYRFFEAILCGAIPVIEEYCDVYEGFKVKYFNEDATLFEYSKADAIYNYNLSVSRITINSLLKF